MAPKKRDTPPAVCFYLTSTPPHPTPPASSTAMPPACCPPFLPCFATGKCLPCACGHSPAHTSHLPFFSLAPCLYAFSPMPLPFCACNLWPPLPAPCPFALPFADGTGEGRCSSGTSLLFLPYLLPFRKTSNPVLIQGKVFCPIHPSLLPASHLSPAHRHSLAFQHKSQAWPFWQCNSIRPIRETVSLKLREEKR